MPTSADSSRSGERAPTTSIGRRATARHYRDEHARGQRNAVAEHTMALMLAIMRRIPAMDAAVRAGQWPRGDAHPARREDARHRRTRRDRDARGDARERVRRAAARVDRSATTADARPPSVRDTFRSKTLLRESDVVTLHLRLSDRTTGYIGPRTSRAHEADRISRQHGAGRLSSIVRHSIDALRGSRIAARRWTFSRGTIAGRRRVARAAERRADAARRGDDAGGDRARLRRAVQNVEAFLAGAEGRESRRHRRG